MSQVGKRLLHLLGQPAGNEALRRLHHGPLQRVPPLLQTQQEALHPMAFLCIRLMVQEVVHTGNLDVGVTRLLQGTGEAPQRLPPAVAGLP